MEFFGPRQADFANVRALNHAWLLRLRDARRGAPLRQACPSQVRALLTGLTDLQLERLAATPFLLFSLREKDDSSWRGLDAASPNRDLFSSHDSNELLTTALSFLWQLAGRNPYAARLVSGAGLEWCERIASCTLLDVLHAASEIDGLLHPRFPADQDFWRKLLGPGLSSNARIGHSAHITCLQRLLTGDPSTGYKRLQTAACRSSVPAMSVAEKARSR